MEPLGFWRFLEELEGDQNGVVRMGVLQITDSKIVFQRRDEMAVLEPYGPDILRFRASPSGRIIEQNWTLLPPQSSDCQFELHDHKAVIKNGKISAEFWDNGKVVYYKDGQVLLAERSEMAFFMGYREYRQVGGDNYRATVIFEPYPNEHFYGLGQEQNDLFDLKGSTSQLLHKNTKSSIPLYILPEAMGFCGTIRLLAL